MQNVGRTASDESVLFHDIHTWREDLTCSYKHTLIKTYKQTHPSSSAWSCDAVLFLPISFYRHYLDLIYAPGLRWLFFIYKSDCTKKLCLKNPAHTTKSNPPINYEGERERMTQELIMQVRVRDREMEREVRQKPARIHSNGWKSSSMTQINEAWFIGSSAKQSNNSLTTPKLERK